MSFLLIYGEDRFLVDRHVRQVKHQWLAEADQQGLLPLLLRQLENPSPASLSETLSTQVFAFGHIPVVEVHQFTPCHKAMSTDTEREQLQQAIEDAVSTKHILLVTSKLDRKLKWVKWLLVQPFVSQQACEPLNFWQTDEAAQRLVTMAKEDNISLASPAALSLIDMHGMDFYTLNQEVHKLATYTAGQPITMDSLKPFMQAGSNLFDAMAAWVQRQPGSKHRWDVLSQVLLTQHPVQLLALFQRFIGDLHELKTLEGQGLSVEGIAQQTGKKPFRVKKELRAYQHIPLARFGQLKRQVLQTEFAIKTGNMDAHLALELLWTS